MGPGPFARDHSPSFQIIFVLGAPGAGKGTICSHLSRTHNLTHISIGDRLRFFVQVNPQDPLSTTIQHKLANQGFLSFTELCPFISEAIKDASKTGAKGILVDGFPRTVQQSEDFEAWALETGGWSGKPDLVLSLKVEREKARERYLSRARDANDSADKFERRFDEYESESVKVETNYAGRGMLVEVDGNGTKEENVVKLTKTLDKNVFWREAFGEKSTS